MTSFLGVIFVFSKKSIMISMVSECDLETILEYARNRSAVIRLILMAENVLLLLLSVSITVNFNNVYRSFMKFFIEFATMENPYIIHDYFHPIEFQYFKLF